MLYILQIHTWYRLETNEWIGEIEIEAEGIDSTIRVTGQTESEARNAAFAAVGYKLLETTFED